MPPTDGAARNAAAPVAGPRAGRRECIGLAMLALPALLVAMDLTVLHLAVPEPSADLRPSASQLLIGAAAFGAASLLAAFSTSAAMLIVARALLGVAGATLAPSTLALIRNMFQDPQQRTVAISAWFMSFLAGAAVGPLLGGALLEFFWWGSAFLIGVPVMVLLLVVGPVLLPEYRDPRAGRLDLASAAIVLGAVLAVIYRLKQIAADGLAVLPALSIVAGSYSASSSCVDGARSTPR